MPKKYNRIKNLKDYAHPAKLPSGGKIGATIKKPRKSNKLKIKSI
jgi:hypothetical protein